METPKWPIKFLDCLKDLNFENANTKLTLESMLNQYRFVDKEIKSVTNTIRSYFKKHYKLDYNLLRSIPGIAGLTAAYILAELGDLRRFTSFKKFASYIGFVPGVP
jgi:transposase